MRSTDVCLSSMNRIHDFHDSINRRFSCLETKLRSLLQRLKFSRKLGVSKIGLIIQFWGRGSIFSYGSAFLPATLQPQILLAPTRISASQSCKLDYHSPCSLLPPKSLQDVVVSFKSSSCGSYSRHFSTNPNSTT